MNYIRINNNFINLRHALHIRVLQSRDSEVVVQVIYPDRMEQISLDTHAGEISDKPVINAQVVSGCIFDAIASCTDADCENVAAYVEDNLDEDEDY